jgi:hypothetical protein
MEPKTRYCKFCGEKFVITNPTEGNRRYCSAECVKEAKRKRWHEWQRKSYVPIKPHEITCKKCGKTFLGKWGAKYCLDCLTDGSEYMTKLYMNRTVNVG